MVSNALVPVSLSAVNLTFPDCQPGAAGSPGAAQLSRNHLSILLHRVPRHLDCFLKQPQVPLDKCPLIDESISGQADVRRVPPGAASVPGWAGWAQFPRGALPASLTPRWASCHGPSAPCSLPDAPLTSQSQPQRGGGLGALRRPPRDVCCIHSPLLPPGLGLGSGGHMDRLEFGLAERPPWEEGKAGQSGVRACSPDTKPAFPSVALRERGPGLKLLAERSTGT